MVPDAPDLSRVKRVLVVKLRHHGDVLLASPVFSVLKNRIPEAEIDALVYDDTREMLSLHPAIAQVHTVGRRWRSLSLPAKIASEWRLLSALRARRYDLLIHLTEHPRGAWISRLLGVRCSVAPADSARRGWWKASFTHHYALVRGGRRHTVESNLDALRRIGIYPSEEERALRLVPGADAESAVDRMLAEHGLEPKRFVHLHPASRWLFKCWTADANAALIDRLQAAGWRVVVTAAPSAKETDLVRAILARTRARVIDLSGKLSLKQLAALTSRARLFVGVDSAPMHIAAAVGTPVVALFGPSGDVEWGPWRVPNRVITSTRHPCRPCGLDGCGGGKVSDCLTSISADTVWNAAREFLDA